MAKPSTKPQWASSASPTTPASGFQTDGWSDGLTPPANHFNWFMKLTYDWIDWLDTEFSVDGSMETLELTGDSGSDNLLTIKNDNAGSGSAIRLDMRNAPLNTPLFDIYGVRSAEDLTFFESASRVWEWRVSSSTAHQLLLGNAGSASFNFGVDGFVTSGGGVSGLNMGMVGLIAAETTDQQVDNTTTRTVLWTKTIPADRLIVGSVIKVRYQIDVTDWTGGGNLEIHIRIGPTGSTALIYQATLSTTGVKTIRGEAELVLKTAGASGVGRSGGGLQTSTGEQDTDYQATSIDTTVANDLNVEAKWATASANNDLTGRYWFAEISDLAS